MALNLNCIEIDLNKPHTCVIDTDTGPVIRCWVPYMGWYYAKTHPDYKGEPEGPAEENLPKYLPSYPCDPSPLKTLIDVL